MNANATTYKMDATVSESNQVVVNLPPKMFGAGECVEVIVQNVAAQDIDRAAWAKELLALHCDLRNLPHIQALTDEDIDAEIAAYRRGE